MRLFLLLSSLLYIPQVTHYSYFHLVFLLYLQKKAEIFFKKYFSYVFVYTVLECHKAELSL